MIKLEEIKLSSFKGSLKKKKFFEIFEIFDIGIFKTSALKFFNIWCSMFHATK